MLRRTALAVNETYHIYNRGAHKNRIFLNTEDRFRFQVLLHLLNNSQSVVFRDLLNKPLHKGRSSVKLFEEEADHALVDVLAYCLMPNHFHLVLRQKTDDGITVFMKKVATAYAMYYNAKHNHSGVLFQGRFQSSHLDGDAYYRYIFTYVHLNPIEMVAPKWQEEGVSNPQEVSHFLRNFPFSSYWDYSVGKRPESVILSHEEAPDFLRTQDDLQEMFATYAKDRPM